MIRTLEDIYEENARRKDAEAMERLRRFVVSMRELRAIDPATITPPTTAGEG